MCHVRYRILTIPYYLEDAMKRAYVSLSILSMLVLALVLAGCEESIENADTGLIEFTVSDIRADHHYYFRGTHTTDDSNFAQASFTAFVLSGNSGEFTTGILNVGSWLCDVYELSESTGVVDTIDPTIITRKQENISVTITKDNTTEIEVTLT